MAQKSNAPVILPSAPTILVLTGTAADGLALGNALYKFKCHDLDLPQFSIEDVRRELALCPSPDSACVRLAGAQ